MDEAAAREGHQISLLLDPPSQLERPFARPSDLEPRLAGQDDAAVDEADDERRELGRRHDHHRLVEERKALGDTAGKDEHVALGVNRERHQLRVAVSLSDLGGLGGGRGRSLEVAHGLLTEDRRQQRVAVHRRFPRYVLEQPVSACQPSARGADRPPVEERHPDPARAVRGTGCLALLEVGVMRPLEDLDRLLVAGEHARGRHA